MVSELMNFKLKVAKAKANYFNKMGIKPDLIIVDDYFMYLIESDRIRHDERGFQTFMGMRIYWDTFGEGFEVCKGIRK